MRRPLREVVTDLVIRRRLAEAFETLAQLPAKDWPLGYRTASCIGSPDGDGKRRAPPASLPDRAQITEMDEAFGWLEYLRHETDQVRHAVQLRARGRSLRQMADQLRCSHVWAGRLEARGVAVIAAALRRVDLLPGMSTIARTDEPSVPPIVRRIRSGRTQHNH